ncbi:hypothetical protein P9239_01945 [Caballeronia sp. LZ062]|uniref:hypothetical protein n=1 Tax=unclassified Caballeronia TaxID=2646786 RepID=UPI00285536F1|nr:MULTISPECIES: hypothetical protein [unclassified Caballeronia]MDR5857572.1 hypothetical protein [Caballeronia sp. LZ050]MDR5869122.1 hypothetical protein [Caballeronia sp. LZ062]
MVRLLATLRRSAQCRALRAAAAQEAMRRAQQEAEEEEASETERNSSSSGDTEARCPQAAHRRMH